MKNANISVQNIQDLFNHGPVVIFKWENTPDWPVSFVTSNVESVLGLSVSDYMNGNIVYSKLIHSDDLKRVKDELNQAIDAKSLALVHSDYRIKGISGDYHWVYDCTHIVWGDDGAPVSFIGYILDITDYKNNERELFENKQRLELVLEGTRLGMWDWNPQTNAVHFNERWAEMLGLKYDDLKQELSDWDTRVHPDDIEGCFADITAHIEGKTSFLG